MLQLKSYIAEIYFLLEGFVLLWHKLSTRKQNYIVIGSAALLSLVVILATSIISLAD